MEFFATCPRGFEPLLAAELKRLGTSRVRPLQGRVSFEDDLAAAYRCLLWSRLASRIICVIGRGAAQDADALFETALSVPWAEHIAYGNTFQINSSGVNANLKNTQFTSLRIKDAITDSLTAATGWRPQSAPKAADVGVVASIAKDHVTLGIDLAGAPLTQRGYERPGKSVGLRADYAAALLELGQWSQATAQGATSIIDCSAYPERILVEAAMIAARRAPGLLRLRWGFDKWAQHDRELWNSLVEQAQDGEVDSPDVVLALTTPNARTRQNLRHTIRAAGVNCQVRSASELAGASFTLCAQDLSALTADDVPQEAASLADLATTCAAHAMERIVCATRDHLPASSLGREEQTTLVTQLGRDPLYLVTFDGTKEAKEAASVEIGQNESLSVLLTQSDQFAKRLKKNARLKAKWAKREDVTCYRVYDADLPDYALTIDLFQGTDPNTYELDGRRWLWVSEYAAPKDVDATLAKSRLMDALVIAQRILGVDERNTYLRIRRHDKGGSQYASEGRGLKEVAKGRTLPPGAHLIEEGGLIFEVNFTSRLDCGIFLDHRDARAMVREMAKQTQGSKRFLNLFAYTGTASCYAADGGAKYTTTVDLSKPSLEWAKRNMERNGFEGDNHEYVQTDVIRWISEQRRTRNRWDLVFCDVPTFSNSKSMGKRSFEVQRDHAELLIGISRLLTRNGVCLFSCNLRSFKPDVEKLHRTGVEIEDITEKTIPEDFKRNARVHHAYLVKRIPMPTGE